MGAVEAQARLTGGCQCGAVRYRLDAAPTGANVCHCRMCQKAGGGAVHGLRRRAAARLVWHARRARDVFASSAIAERGFCAACGTPLTYRLIGHDRISVTIGSLDDPGRRRARRSIRRRIETAVARRASLAAAARHAALAGAASRDVGNRQHPDHDT